MLPSLHTSAGCQELQNRPWGPVTNHGWNLWPSDVELHKAHEYCGFPYMGVPRKEWFIRETPENLKWMIKDLEVSRNRGTPSHHPFSIGIFTSRPSSYWGNPIYGNLPMESSSVMGVPQQLDGFFHSRKSENNMDNLGVPPIFGNLHIYFYIALLVSIIHTLNP